MWWMLLGVAWAGKWDGLSADVEVKQVVPLSREEIQRVLGDWSSWQRLLPCAAEWELQERTTGVGARARALYLIGPLRQRLVGVIRKDEPGLVLEVETEGKRGWITQLTFADAPGGATEVRLLTPLSPPKWPLKGVYFQEVRPAWQRCHADLLGALSSR